MKLNAEIVYSWVLQDCVPDIKKENKKMKRLMLFVLLLVVVTLTACVAIPSVNPPTALGQALVALPEEATLLISALLTSVLTFLLLKVNMGALTQPIVAVIAPMIITFFESLLQTIPPVFDNLVLSIIHVIVLAITSYGTYVLAMRAKAPKALYDSNHFGG